MFITDESMEEFAQWQHDTAWEFEPVAVPTEADIENCEIGYLTECLNGQHTLLFTIVNGSFKALCQDGCLA